MASNCGQFIRLSLLVVLGVSSIGILGKVVLDPKSPQSSIRPFQFPATVPLDGWVQQSSLPLRDPSQPHLHARSGMQYHYVRGDRSIDIGMHYIVDTDGDVEQFLHTYHDLDIALNPSTLRRRDGMGSYSLFTHEGQSYLTACINPYGGSTVTEREFKVNRNFQDIRFRWLPWLLGQPLKDERCLWTYLSLSTDAEPAATDALLEAVWLRWYAWWSLRFPMP